METELIQVKVEEYAEVEEDVEVEEVYLDDLFFENGNIFKQFSNVGENDSNIMITDEVKYHPPEEQSLHVDELLQSDEPKRSSESVNKLKIYKRRFIESNQFKCVTCSKRFATELSLKEHQTIVDVKKYECEICSKPFSTESKLKKHTVYKHKAKHECETCLKCFQTSSKLKSHMTTHPNIHTKEKVYECEICSKQFGIKSSLNRHRKSHTAEKSTFKCEICSNCFETDTELKTHMDLHNRENLTLCDNGDLNKHSKDHTGKMPCDNSKVILRIEEKVSSTKECRLCLRSPSAKSSLSIDSYSDLLKTHIWSYYQPQVKHHNELPDTICLSCESTLKLLVDFKKSCIQNDRTARWKLEHFGIEVKEVLLDDLTFKEMDNVIQSSSVHIDHSYAITSDRIEYQTPHSEEKFINVHELSQHTNESKSSPVIFQSN